ncbi:DUF6166 domain-containing protein [Roseovarius sp. THAF8]|uniref:DUF6166 domain-containing protein n=1 Tax=Roseovarius sp. THAF8 TaxID=2587846 RepID=UPI001561BA2F|nr:DUF6166 domain-containing protein [Roseovarius sp. THAF8]
MKLVYLRLTMAFALIHDVTGDAGLDRRPAEPFMREVTVDFGNDWEMTEADIRAAIIQVQPEQRERLRKYEPGTCRSCPAAVTAFAAGGRTARRGGLPKVRPSLAAWREAP